MKEPREMKFSFQEIPLEEAKHLSAAEGGRYADLVMQLLKRLPNLPPDKAFAFGAGNGHAMEHAQSRGICMSLNRSLRKAACAWRVFYAPSKQLFVCEPTQAKAPAAKRTPREDSNELPQKIKELRNSGMKPKAIAQALGLTVKQVYHHMDYGNKSLVGRTKQVFQLLKSGSSRAEVMKKLGVSYGAVSDAVYVARKKGFTL